MIMKRMKQEENDMTDFLVKLFIKNRNDIHDPQVRKKYGSLGGIVGIICNIILFTLKFLAGVLTSSISITADAFNNLSDAGSSIITLVGFKMASMPSDDEHPFGHGRIEYVSGLIVSLIIMLMGVELFKSSVEKIISPETITFQWLSLGILIFSILLKLWMALFNRRLGKKINSVAMQATAADSLSDVIATTAVVIGILVFYFFHLNIDGWIGVVVALFILYTGFTTARDTMNSLLGQAPDAEFVKAVEEKVLSYPDVVGVHDLIIHNYGPGRCLISLHAEVPCDIDILSIHDAIDNIERDLNQTFQCETVIHMDPISLNDKEANRMYDFLKALVAELDPVLSIHDFRMVAGPTHTNLIFDVVVPHKYHLSDEEVREKINQLVKEKNTSYETVMNIDHSVS